ncbi:MAG: hypothetical protein IPG80_07575 [Anaerolineales bacterium]|uniref:ABC transporter substrate-binding protein n=1 Tax=Candidatus Villigracilis vicinus TaxID=3140679 RepID=UPI003136E5D5|nr:hypothetical protein [Anaerolineales bacterium]
MTITYKLKDCIFWSDGEPITSADFVFNWQAAMDPANAPVSRGGWDKIASVEAPDERTVVITFSELYPSWPTIFNLGPNNLSGGLLPAHVFEGQTGLETNPADPPTHLGWRSVGHQRMGTRRSHDPRPQPELLRHSRQVGLYQHQVRTRS